MSARPFREHGIVPLATGMQICKKGDVVEIQGMGTVQTGMPHQCVAHSNTGGVHMQRSLL